MIGSGIPVEQAPEQPNDRNQSSPDDRAYGSPRPLGKVQQFAAREQGHVKEPVGGYFCLTPLGARWMVTPPQEGLTAPRTPNATPANNNEPIRPLRLLLQSETLLLR